MQIANTCRGAMTTLQISVRRLVFPLEVVSAVEVTVATRSIRWPSRGMKTACRAMREAALLAAR